MFTGIVETVGRVLTIESNEPDVRMCIEPGSIDLLQIRLGDSICVSGACLTVVLVERGGFWVDVSGATLACTTLGTLQVGDAVNLEQAVTPSTRLGGHLVTGHVDAVGEVREWRAVGQSHLLAIEVPVALLRYIAPKGSVCIDGVSLTINDVREPRFEINIIPHTLAVTTLQAFEVGRRVNVEVDLMARYVEQILKSSESPRATTPGQAHQVGC
jgi:riboflavin synthase